jgi:hypothetical protein
MPTASVGMAPIGNHLPQQKLGIGVGRAMVKHISDNRSNSFNYQIAKVFRDSPR